LTVPFGDLGLSAPVLATLARRGLTATFPVQARTIPAALAGRDVSGRAPTGSGKTLAFGLPLVDRVTQADAKRPRALVLAPTRELAHQIAGELRPYADAVGRRVLAVYGGTSMTQQRRALQRGVDVVVACPGRLQDLVDQKAVDLRDVEIAVVDEADRMADMGFLPAVRRLLDRTSPQRQVLLFSATLDGDVGALVRAYQHDPLEVVLDGDDDGGVPVVDHEFHPVERHARPAALAAMLRDGGRTIVFCRTRHGVDRLVKHLERAGVRAVGIHGGHAQSRRARALGDFTHGRVQVLVATDVAARGIHVDGIEHVVHYDVASDAKTYIHRSGRTARAGASGAVVSFVGGDEVKQVASLRRELGLVDTASSASHGHGRSTARNRRRRSAAPARRTRR
jgi:superfamily II DNA/RNA helicase